MPFSKQSFRVDGAAFAKALGLGSISVLCDSSEAVGNGVLAPEADRVTPVCSPQVEKAIYAFFAGRGVDLNPSQVPATRLLYEPIEGVLHVRGSLAQVARVEAVLKQINCLIQIEQTLRSGPEP